MYKGGAPRNPAPRSHLVARSVKPSGCRCTDGHLTSRVVHRGSKDFAECRTPRRSTFSPSPMASGSLRRMWTPYWDAAAAMSYVVFTWGDR